MKIWAVAAALLTGALLLATDAGAQSRRDRAYDYNTYDSYDQRTNQPQYDRYGRRITPRDRSVDEQEAYERGRRDEQRLQDRTDRREPTLGEQLGDMIDRGTKR